MKRLPIGLEDLVILCFWDEKTIDGKKFRDSRYLIGRAFIMATFLGDNSDYSHSNGLPVASQNLEKTLDEMADKGIISRRVVQDGNTTPDEVFSYLGPWRDYYLVDGEGMFEDLAKREPEVFRKCTRLFNGNVNDNPTEAVEVVSDILNRNQPVNEETIREGIINTLFETWLNAKRIAIGGFLDGFYKTNTEEV